MAPPFLYTTLAVDKVNGHGLSNTARHEHLPKKTVGLLRGTNESERFNYKGEWASA